MNGSGAVNVDMVKIPRAFTMGSPASEHGHEDDENQH